MNNKTKNIKFYTDPGHGWLAVKAKELVELGIDDKISAYSYINGQTVYLEEDCDAQLYLQVLKQKGIEVVVIEKHHYSTSYIRNYDSYARYFILR